MGYTITIGEAFIKNSRDMGYPGESIIIAAEGAESSCAPVGSLDSPQANWRSPDYLTWRNFCDATGLTPLFFGDDKKNCPEEFHREFPLMAQHPGAAPLIEADARYIRNALEAYRQKPKPEPGWLERLEWLDFWVPWALANCTNPIIENS